MTGNRISILTVFFLVTALLLIETTSAQAEKKQVLIVKSEATLRWLKVADVPGQIFNQTNIWKDLLPFTDYEINSASETSLNSITEYDLIILTNTICLGENEIKSLLDFLASGGAVLATSNTGSRNYEGLLYKVGFLEQVLGSKVISTGREAGKSAALNLRNGMPGTSSIPPGYYLRLVPYSKPLYLPDTDQVDVVGYWDDNGYSEKIAEESKRKAGFVTRRLKNGGRIAWLGSSIEGIHGDKINKEMYVPLFQDLFSWLCGEGLVGVEPWPKGKNCACLIHGDIEHQFTNVKDAVNLFKKLKVNTSYNLLMCEGSKYPEEMTAIAELKDSEIAIHSDNHDLYAGQSLDIQQTRLGNTIRVISLYAPRPVGFRPPELEFDNNTLKALDLLKFEYMSADSIADRFYPRLLNTGLINSGSGKIVIFPKCELDDYDLFSRFDIVSPTRMEQMILRDFERIRNTGGLYKLNYHTQYLPKRDFLNVLERSINQIKIHEDVWIATAKDISRWIRGRDNLSLSYESTDSEIKLSLTNKGSYTLNNVVLRVIPPVSTNAEMMTARKTSKSCTYVNRDDMFFLNISRLEPGRIFEASLVPSRALIASGKNDLYMTYLTKIIVGAAVIFLAWAVYYLSTKRRKNWSLIAASLTDEEINDESHLDQFTFRGYSNNPTSIHPENTQSNSVALPTEEKHSSLIELLQNSNAPSDKEILLPTGENYPDALGTETEKAEDKLVENSVIPQVDNKVIPQDDIEIIPQDEIKMKTADYAGNQPDEEPAEAPAENTISFRTTAERPNKSGSENSGSVAKDAFFKTPEQAGIRTTASLPPTPKTPGGKLRRISKPATHLKSTVGIKLKSNKHNESDHNHR